MRLPSPGSGKWAGSYTVTQEPRILSTLDACPLSAGCYSRLPILGPKFQSEKGPKIVMAK